MKKTLIIGIISAAVSTVSSFGQGHVYFANYYPGNSGASPVDPAVIAPISYASTGVPAGLGGFYLGNGFSAELMYQIGAGSWTALASSITPFLGTADSANAGDNGGAGFFVLGALDIPGYVSGPINFQVYAFNTAQIGTYAPGTITGSSAIWTASAIATGLTSGGGLNWQNQSGSFGSFTVAAVPEPSTLALAGLGGFGMLMALRRKKA